MKNIYLCCWSCKLWIFISSYQDLIFIVTQTDFFRNYKILEFSNLWITVRQQPPQTIFLCEGGWEVVYIFFIFRGNAWNVIGGDDCVGVMVPGNLVTVTVPQGQEMTEDFKFPLVLILQSSWDIYSYIFCLQWHCYQDNM